MPNGQHSGVLILIATTSALRTMLISAEEDQRNNGQVSISKETFDCTTINQSLNAHHIDVYTRTNESTTHDGIQQSVTAMIQ